MTETVLINVKLEGTENEAKINSLSKSINDLNEENKKLIENNKKLAKAEGDNSAEIAKNSSQIELNKQKITESSASRKGLIQTIVAEDNSIKALSVRNAELRKQRDLINTSTDEGRKKIQQINAEIDKNNSVIKDNNDALGAQKINIGNYASALDSVVPGLSGMVSGIQGATKASLAFIATPLGAVLAALGLALGTLTSYFKGSEEGQNSFAKISRATGVILNNLLDIVQDVGAAVFKFLSGDLDGAAESIKAAYTGAKNIISETNAELKESSKLAELEIQIREKERKLILDRAKTDLEVGKLRERAIKEEGSVKRKTIEEAIALEKKLSDQEVGLAKSRLELAKRQAELSKNTIEDNTRLIELEAEVIKAETSGYQNTLRLSKQLETALDQENKKNEEYTKNKLDSISKIQEAEDKAYLAKLKRQEEEDKRRDEELKKVVEKIEAEDTAKLLSEDLTVGIAQETADTLSKLDEEAIQRGRRVAEFNKKYNAEITKSEQVKNQQMASLQSQAFALGSQLAGKNKTLQTGLALTSTYFSAQKAYESQFIPIADITSPVRGAIAAAIAVASGLANVASINGIKFAKGGIAAIGGLLSGPSHSQGGIPFSVGGRLGFEAEGGEAIINKRSTAMYAPLLSQINQAGGGRAFALGGMTGNEVRSASSFASGQFNANQIASLINQVKIVQVLQDFEAVQYSRNNDVVKATVIS